MSTEIPADDLADEVVEAFTSRWGTDPDGLWRAPGRVNVIGEHVDYQAGLCLPIALPHSTFAAVRRRDDDVVRLHSLSRPDEDWEGRLDDIGPGSPSGWAGYLAGVLWALREDGVDVPGVDCAVASAVPLGAGLSSSASLECSLAIALADLLGLPTDDAGRARLADACVRAENEVAQASTGGLDQAASLRSVEGHALLVDCRDGSVEPVPLRLEDEGLVLLVVDTRAPHRLVDSEYASRRSDCERAASLLGVSTLREIDDLDAALARVEDDDPALVPRVRHVVTEIERVRRAVEVLRNGAAADLGPLLSASHASLRDDYEVSSPELDLVVDTAGRTGALGARMTGGGFGGSAVVLLRDEQVPETESAVSAAFAEKGWDAPAFVRAVAGAPAARVPRG
jgi:galactokinase